MNITLLAPKTLPNLTMETLSSPNPNDPFFASKQLPT